MKMDLELIRKTLLFIEENGEFNNALSVNRLVVLNYPLEEIAYNLKLLEDAGYVELMIISSKTSYDCLIKRMTFQGHQYLDTVRDDTVWGKTKEKLKEVSGTASIDTVKALASKIAETILLGQ